MAEITSEGAHRRTGPGVKKSKKLSTRVDLTPMVDLGFLLITFFIFTTTMSRPTAMRLFLPKDTDSTNVKQSGTLTVMLGKNNRIFYYEGFLAPGGRNMKSADHKGIRDILINKKRTTKPEDLVVVIKPTPEATYKNTVDILDEMTINDVKRYAMVDVAESELQVVRASEAR